MFCKILPLSLLFPIVFLQACAMNAKDSDRFEGEILPITKGATLYEGKVRFETYSVSGKTIKDVSTNLDHNLGKPSSLKTNLRSQSTLNLSYKYRLSCGKGMDHCTEENVSTCKLKDIQVWTKAGIVLPVHSDKTSLCPYASGVWDRFEKSIKDYELGHVANLKQSALDLGRGLTQLTSDKKFKRCAQIETAISDLYSIHLAKLNFKNLEYDIQSDHGENSGACFGPHCEGYNKAEDQSCGNAKAWK